MKQQNAGANGPVRLNIGVIVIGSLFWDSQPARQQWRENRLSMTEAKLAWLPIRYGRVSASRSNTHTMVFSAARYRRKQLGMGWVIPCAQTVTSFDDLHLEATELAKAEGLSSWTWGGVALLKNVHSEIPKKIIQEWRRYFASQAQKCRVMTTYLRSEWPALGKTGVLRMRWPKPVGQQFDFDLLLATPTQPSLVVGTNKRARYPSAEEIGSTFVAKALPDYFINNVRNSIRTAQDHRIWNAMVMKCPEWEHVYAEVSTALGVTTSLNLF